MADNAIQQPNNNRSTPPSCRVPRCRVQLPGLLSDLIQLHFRPGAKLAEYARKRLLQIAAFRRAREDADDLIEHAKP
jgi:hypothetical protein